MKFALIPPKGSAPLSRTHLFLIALALALSMWYLVTHSDTKETQVEIVLSYTGIPRDLFVTNGLIYSVKERIQGPQMLIDKIPKTFPLLIDASHITVGNDFNNTFSIRDELEKNINRYRLRAFRIANLEHQTIRLTVVNRDSHNIPLDIRLQSSDVVIPLKRSHSSVTFSGPEDEIKKLKELSVWPIVLKVDPVEAGKGIIQKDIPIILPHDIYPHVTPIPPSVKVEYEVRGERKVVSYNYPINLAVANPSQYEVSPATVTLRLEVPDDKKNDGQYLKELRVTALPPNMVPGERKRVPLNFTSPEGMQVLDTSITVTILRLQDARHAVENFNKVERIEQKTPEQEQSKRRKRRHKVEKDAGSSAESRTTSKNNKTTKKTQHELEKAPQNKEKAKPSRTRERNS